MNPLDALRQEYLNDLKEEEEDYKSTSISNDSISKEHDEEYSNESLSKKSINRSFTRGLLPFPISYPKKLPKKLNISDETLLGSNILTVNFAIDTQESNMNDSDNIYYKEEEIIKAIQKDSADSLIQNHSSNFSGLKNDENKLKENETPPLLNLKEKCSSTREMKESIQDLKESKLQSEPVFSEKEKSHSEKEKSHSENDHNRTLNDTTKEDIDTKPSIRKARSRSKVRDISKDNILNENHQSHGADQGEEICDLENSEAHTKSMVYKPIHQKESQETSTRDKNDNNRTKIHDYEVEFDRTIASAKAKLQSRSSKLVSPAQQQELATHSDNDINITQNDQVDLNGKTKSRKGRSRSKSARVKTGSESNKFTEDKDHGIDPDEVTQETPKYNKSEKSKSSTQSNQKESDQSATPVGNTNKRTKSNEQSKSSKVNHKIDRTDNVPELVDSEKLYQSYITEISVSSTQKHQDSLELVSNTINGGDVNAEMQPSQTSSRLRSKSMKTNDALKDNEFTVKLDHELNIADDVEETGDLESPNILATSVQDQESAAHAWEDENRKSLNDTSEESFDRKTASRKGRPRSKSLRAKQETKETSLKDSIDHEYCKEDIESKSAEEDSHKSKNRRSISQRIKIVGSQDDNNDLMELQQKEGEYSETEKKRNGTAYTDTGRYSVLNAVHLVNDESFEKDTQIIQTIKDGNKRLEPYLHGEYSNSDSNASKPHNATSSALKRMIPDLSKEKVDDEIKKITSKPKSILKKPHVYEALDTGNNENIDIVKGKILKPAGRTEIIYKPIDTVKSTKDDEHGLRSVKDETNHTEDHKSMMDHEFENTGTFTNFSVLQSIPRAQTAPSKLRAQQIMKDSQVQTFEVHSEGTLNKKIEQIRPDASQITDTFNQTEPENHESETQSRASSPEGYMLAYKMSNQKLHFDPGVYDHFKGIDSAKQWLIKKKIPAKNIKKNSKPLEKNLSSITEDILSGREDNRKITRPVSDSDDESLRREAVRQSSFIGPDQQAPRIFEASTQTDFVIDEKKKKVRISPEKSKDSKTPMKRITNIDLTNQAPSKYLEKYLSSGKKKTKRLPAITEPLFSPVKPRPVSRSSSSRSRSSSQNSSSDALKRHKKPKGKYSKIRPKINTSNHYESNPITEYQMNPYMPASWYMTYDYISPSAYGPSMESLERGNPKDQHSQYMTAPVLAPILNHDHGNEMTRENIPYYTSNSSVNSRSKPRHPRNNLDMGTYRPWH